MPQDTGTRIQTIRGALQNPEEMIRTRTYELFEERGREVGHELDGWLRAEEEETHCKTHTTAAR